MTRYEYTVTAQHRRTHVVLELTCWGDNQRDAIDHARTALSNNHGHAVTEPHYKFVASRTGKRVAGVA